VKKTNGRFLLKTAVDTVKDQSYFLYALTPDQLSQTIFPRGEFKKQDVRAMAQTLGLQTADRPESQDFIAGGDYSMLFKDRQIKPGKIVDEGGKVLGTHRGIINYTIGQRRGLGIASDRPLYVKKIDPQNHQIVVSAKENLVSEGLIADDVNLIAIDRLDRPLPVKVKIRLNQTAIDATVYPNQAGKVKIIFKKPQLSVCPGQHAVWYSGDTVIGGGVIVQAV
jgi:tRNA-specific 2-thiouridylase